MTTHTVHYTSARTSNGRDDWGTPRDLFERLDAEFGFGLDCAASNGNALCKRWLGPGTIVTGGENALATDSPWYLIAHGKACYLNPPYSMLRAFMTKAREESERGAIVVCLIPARTDTRAWHLGPMHAAEIRLIRGRLRFDGAKASAPFPSAIVVFRPGCTTPILSAMDARP